MSIIDVSVHPDTHKALRSGQQRSTCVCALMPTHACVRAHKHTVTHTTTHLCLQMETHSSPDHLQWGLKLFSHSDTSSFIHSFAPSTLLSQPLCANSGAGHRGGGNKQD